MYRASYFVYVCVLGYYNNQYHQPSCQICPVSYYCPNSAMTTFNSFLCPLGHYCPAGTSSPISCPLGSFSTQLGNVFLSDCIPCTPGYFCNTVGAHNVTGICQAGYYCNSMATTAIQPFVTGTGGPCPAGHYCPPGSGNPLVCPRFEISLVCNSFMFLLIF